MPQLDLTLFASLLNSTLFLTALCAVAAFEILLLAVLAYRSRRLLTVTATGTTGTTRAAGTTAAPFDLGARRAAFGATAGSAEGLLLQALRSLWSTLSTYAANAVRRSMLAAVAQRQAQQLVSRLLKPYDAAAGAMAAPLRPTP